MQPARRLAAAGFCLLSFAPPGYAKPATTNAFQMWYPTYIQFPLYRQWRGYFEINPRLNDGLDGIRQLPVRPGLEYRFNSHVAVVAGYLWVPTFKPVFVDEQRLWQQLGLGFTVKNFQILSRTRMEERFIEHVTGTALRLREMIRVARPLGHTRWYAVGLDELFVNFNSRPGGPRAGIDQNRLFGGLGRQINDKMRVEIGYQLQYVHNPGRNRANNANHILMTQVFLDF